jgi:hypothetical protein
MHDLVLQASGNQHEELEDLKELISTLQGREYVPTAALPELALRELHPRGPERFAAEDAQKRLAQIPESDLTVGLIPT